MRLLRLPYGRLPHPVCIRLSRSDPDGLYISMSPSMRPRNGHCSNYPMHFAGDRDCKFLLHDRHRTLSASLDEAVESWGIHVLRSLVHMPTANTHCERLIGTIRRGCLDYLIRLNSAHLRRILREWVGHYNSGRPHRSPGPGIPHRTQIKEPTCSRITRFPSPSGVIAEPILGGLHHEY